MAEIVSEVVRAVLADQARKITKADGYLTDAGRTVTLEPHYVDPDSPPFVGVIMERQGKATDGSLTRTHRLTTYGVIAKVPTSMDAAQATLAAIVSDLERALPGVPSDYPRGAQFPQYEGMEPIPPQPGMDWVGVVLRYSSHTPIR
ncbi:hypothetical protein [[Pseudomonas] boreopolis]|uniref:Tail terminator n=1 Tax=Xanthomonas boreopolis TaxID=86183 RepID=A0A919F797_9XANT|nr:hypothetical protein GCM10009090_16600 [[Pseudomonas] boreopolis]